MLLVLHRNPQIVCVYPEHTEGRIMWQFARRETLRSSVMVKGAVQKHIKNVHVNENALSNAEV
jgi:hypothetical protein